MLARYFNEMAALTVFEPWEEIEKARAIRRNEVALWSEILGHPSLLSVLLGLIKARIDGALDGDFAALT